MDKSRIARLEDSQAALMGVIRKEVLGEIKARTTATKNTRNKTTQALCYALVLIEEKLEEARRQR